jgi:hypothetical protein
MEGGIRLAQALELMETAQEPFTLRFVTCDRRRKTGGQIVEWQNCRLSGPHRVRAKELAQQAADTGARHHRHYANGTRNVVIGKSSQRRKVHIWLLLSLNGKKIVL